MRLTSWLAGSIARHGGRLAAMLVLVAIVGMGPGVPAAQANSCTRQCRLAGVACTLPFKVVFQTLGLNSVDYGNSVITVGKQKR